MNNAQRLKSSKCDTLASESYKTVLVSHTFVTVWKSRFQFPTRKNFFLLQNIQTACGGHTSFYSKDTEGKPAGKWNRPFNTI